MTEHTHHHDEDSACGVAHSPVAPASSPVPAERTLVAVFASPVAGYCSGTAPTWGPQPAARAGRGAARPGPLPSGSRCSPAIHPTTSTAVTDVVLTDHHRSELGVILRDALATKARWVGIMGILNHVGRTSPC